MSHPAHADAPSAVNDVPDLPALPDAQALVVQLQRGVAALLQQVVEAVEAVEAGSTPGQPNATPPAQAYLVGITSGGAWLAQHLQAALGLPGQAGVISSSLHRDDFSTRGLAAAARTQIDFDVNGAHIILIDDVLYTGRTIRAVINELYDHGRPASVRLAVLVDRGGRQLPIQPDFAAHTVQLPPGQSLALRREGDGFALAHQATKRRA